MARHGVNATRARVRRAREVIGGTRNNFQARRRSLGGENDATKQFRHRSFFDAKSDTVAAFIRRRLYPSYGPDFPYHSYASSI
jgi:hypothetical protein